MSLLTAILLVVFGILLASWLWTRHLARGAVRAIPQAGQIVPVAGGSIHYTDDGPRDGVVLVMIHGLSGNLHNFNHSLVSQLSSEFRVISIDRPGTGYSSRDDDDLALFPAQARMIGEFLDKLEIDRPVLVGHSLGGAIALAMAVERPDKASALALICPLTQFMPEPPAVFKPLVIRSKSMRRLIGHLIAVPIAYLTRNTVLTQVFAPEPIPGDFMLKGGGALGLRPEGFIAASADLFGATVSTQALAARYAAELKMPGGVLFGADDAILSPADHGQAMQAHGLFFEALPGRGHMIPVTAPEQCAGFIRRVTKMIG